MNPIAQLFRFVIMVLLALAGLAMAFVFILSTAVALGVMYVVARVRGQPFAPAEFWRARREQMRWQFVNGRWQAPGQNGASTAHAGAGASSQANSHSQGFDAGPGQNGSKAARRPLKRQDDQIIDVEVRDIN